VTAPVFVVPPTALEGVGPGAIVRVDGPEGRHAVSVRRLTVGESVDLVDGAGVRASGTVAAIVDRHSLDVRVDDTSTEPQPEPAVVVVQALPKGDRGELAVELLTEVGADIVVPWAAATCVTQWRPDRIERAHQRWVDAAHAAGKQSRRTRFPIVAPLASTADVVGRLELAALGVVLHESAEAAISDLSLPQTGEVVIVVGPEGGITDDELGRFSAAGAHLVRLGPSVLRTSSAGMAAVAALLAPSPRWAVRRGAGMGG